MTEKAKRTRVPADPEKWSESSKKSLAYELFAPDEYSDIHFLCWRCAKATVYPAEDQRLDYETLKAYIDQRRILCPECWKQSQTIANDIRVCEVKWSASKKSLRNNAGFLSQWLQLLVAREAYVPYKPNTAAKNMLKKLLKANA